MRRRRVWSLFALLVLLLCPARGARGQPGAAINSEAVEARQRFERGLRLFNAGDDAGALAEFKRAYELTASVVALYNMGLVYAQMGRAVEATDALDRVLAAPGSLSPERVALARQRRDEQAARVASVEIVANIDNAGVEVDGVEAARTPLAGLLRVTSGAHIIGIIASGYEPARKEIMIAGGERQSLRLDLVAMQGRLAHLLVKTHLPSADVFVDDHRVATTPLASSITLPPGAHRIELRRAGYLPAQTQLVLGDGATGEVTLEPEEDRAALAADGGQLALDVSETLPAVTVDGRARGAYTGPLRLMRGPHRLLIERGDFEPAERDVTVVAQGAVTIRVVFEPTPDYRARYVSHTQTLRTWGIIGVSAGVALAGGGAGLLVFDAKQRSDANSVYESLTASPVCAMGQEAAVFQKNCGDPVNAAAAKVNDANTRDYAAWSAVGVGAVAVGLGITLFLSNDPHKYDAPPGADRVARLPLSPVFWTARGGGGFGVVGAF
jgi:PEGA domain